MHYDEKMKAVIDGLRYDCSAAKLVADDAWWDGHNYERRGRNQFLFRTPNGRYFFQYQTQWQGETDRLEACSVDEAIRFWESVQGHDDCVYLPFSEAFPDVKIEEA